jgi:hypothetical protein
MVISARTRRLVLVVSAFAVMNGCAGPPEIATLELPLAVDARWEPRVRRGGELVTVEGITSSDPAVARVETSPLAVIGVAPGHATLTVQAGGSATTAIEVAEPEVWAFGWGEPAAMLDESTYQVEVQARDARGRVLRIDGLDPVTPANCATLFDSTRCIVEPQPFVMMTRGSPRRIPAVSAPDHLAFKIVGPADEVKVTVAPRAEGGALVWRADAGTVLIPDRGDCTVIRSLGPDAEEICTFTREIRGTRSFDPYFTGGGSACPFDARSFYLRVEPGRTCELAVVFQVPGAKPGRIGRSFITTARIADGAYAGEADIEFTSDPGIRVPSQAAADAAEGP